MEGPELESLEESESDIGSPFVDLRFFCGEDTVSREELPSSDESSRARFFPLSASPFDSGVVIAGDRGLRVRGERGDLDLKRLGGGVDDGPGCDKQIRVRRAGPSSSSVEDSDLARFFPFVAAEGESDSGLGAGSGSEVGTRAVTSVEAGTTTEPGVEAETGLDPS